MLLIAKICSSDGSNLSIKTQINLHKSERYLSLNITIIIKLLKLIECVNRIEYEKNYKTMWDYRYILLKLSKKAVSSC